MDNLTKNLIVAIFAIAYFVWWWSIAKEARYRRYILLTGLCFLVAGAAAFIGVSMDLPFLGPIGLVALVLAFYFLIKAALAAHRVKNQTPNE